MPTDTFVHQYLNRLKLHGNILPDLHTLKQIQKQHLLHIPFENLDIIDERRIDFDVLKLWSKIVEHNRGGICYELNGLLFHLLRSIGFDVKYIAGQVLENGNEFDHVLLAVLLDEEQWLVDVGFGDHFMEPVRLNPGVVQKDCNGDFIIVQIGEDNYQLYKSLKGSVDSLEYTFSLQERKLNEFTERCLYFETSPESRFRTHRLCTLERDNGRVSLTEHKLILTEGGQRTEKEVKDSHEYAYLLREIFGIHI